MAGLQRFVTYIYKYENDEKRENAGFAKTEIRGGTCRVEVHIRNTDIEQSECTVYLFARKNDRMLAVPVGNISMKRGNGDVRYSFETKELLSFGVSMEQMEGIFIPLDHRDYLASQWKEGEIRRGRLKILEKKEERQKSEEREADRQEMTVSNEEILQKTNPVAESVREEGSNPVAESVREEESNPVAESAQEERSNPVAESVREEESNPVAESAQEEESNPVEETMQKQESNSTAETTREKEQKEENIRATEIPMERFFEESGWEGVFQKLRLKLTVFFPFEGQEIECIRMELKDLHEFPKKYWYLGNNSFLLHGFFNYRHVVLGQMTENGRKEYFIGVPGVFQNQERIMASMFGFPEFRTASASEHKTGNFGYWYRVI